MGLLNIYLYGDGTNLGAYYTAGQPNTILATRQSPLHVYSSGRNELFQDVNNALQAYDDGVTNFVPQPSQLDINNGYTPNQYRFSTPEGVNLPINNASYFANTANNI